MYETDNMIVDVLHIVDDAFHADERINQIFFFLRLRIWLMNIVPSYAIQPFRRDF